jgi:hypothetical protein
MTDASDLPEIPRRCAPRDDGLVQLSRLGIRNLGAETSVLPVYSWHAKRDWPVRMTFTVRAGMELHLYEEATIRAFVAPVKRARFLQLLANPERRPKVLNELNHFTDWDERYVQSLPSSTDVEAVLRAAGAPEVCHVISDDPRLDGQDLPYARRSCRPTNSVSRRSSAAIRDEWLSSSTKRRRTVRACFFAGPGHRKCGSSSLPLQSSRGAQRRGISGSDDGTFLPEIPRVATAPLGMTRVTCPVRMVEGERISINIAVAHALSEAVI